MKYWVIWGLKSRIKINKSIVMMVNGDNDDSEDDYDVNDYHDDLKSY